MLALAGAIAMPPQLSHAQPIAPPRRVNIPYLTEPVDWAQSAIFWFGVNDWYQTLPGRNYADVRVAYTASGLRVKTVVVDYYLWYSVNPSAATDLTQYDGVAVYLDTNHDRAASPQTDDYRFVSGVRYNSGDSRYRRQARGTGSGWNTAWAGSWSDFSGMQWNCNPGPNSNVCGIDFGWTSTITIPWQTLGLPGPPAQGTVWGLGVQLYDRDDNPPAGAVAPEFWPETFNTNQPGTWGEVHFGYARYPPPPAAASGSAMIRAALPTDNTVEDAWVGGGGTCSGGHEGGSDLNHGEHGALYVGTETAPTHFPCFNKSFLRFNLNAIPANKVILSATLTLHVWGNAGDVGQAQPSWVHLFTVNDPWLESGITWNNAPLAQENISAIWMYPYSQPGQIEWPGDPYTWDATQAVAEAYAAGQPVSLAIYGSDTAQHSSKYLTSSEVGLGDSTPNWDIEGRPRLDVRWGESVAEIRKTVSPAAPNAGDVVRYTLTFAGNGQALVLTDTLPTQVSAPGPINASSGSASYNAGARQVRWNGTIGVGQPVTITFPVTVNIGLPRMAVSNTVVLSDAQGRSSTANAVFIVNAYRTWLPIVLKQP